MSNDPFSRSTAANLIYQQAGLPRNLMGGTDTMRTASLGGLSASAGAVSTTYLPRWPLETEDAWRSRIASTFLTPYYSRAWQTVVGKAFSENVELGDDVAPEIVSLWENIDNAGAHGDVFCQWVFGDSLHVGIGHILVDYPVADGVQTLADERSLGLRPNWVYVPGDAVLGVRSEIVNGRVRLTQFRYLEETVEADGPFGEKPVKRVRVYYASDAENPYARCEVYVMGKDGAQLERANVLRPHTEIPVSTFYARRTGWQTARPFLQELAWVNLEAWQSGSDQRNILHFARVPFYHFAGFTKEEIDAFTGVGGAARAWTTDPSAQIHVVEGTGAAIGEGWKDLDRLDRDAKGLSLEPMVSGFAAESATGRAIDEARAHSALESAIRNFEDCIEGALGFTAIWMGLDSTAGGSVSLVEELSAAQNVAEKAQIILTAERNGLISKATAREQLHELHIFSETFDPDAEGERAEQESASAMATFGAFGQGNASDTEDTTPQNEPQPAEEAA